MTTPDVFRDAEYIADVSGIQYGSVTEISPTLQDERLKKKLQSAAKIAFIDRLLRDLDILIYCELSALYYMDCSIVLFAVRAIIQLIFFTPKAPPFEPTRNQPFVGAIFTSNIFCMIFHSLFSQLEAGEDTRGYLHGGLLIDFIGQKAPVPLARLLSLDLLVLFVHLVMLGLILERVKTADSGPTFTPATTATATNHATEPPETQDHDLEERGLRSPDHDTDRTSSSQSSTSGEAEPEFESESREPDSHNNTTTTTSTTTPNTPPDTQAHLTGDEEFERTRLLADPSENGHTSYQHALDPFSSGEAVIMRLGLFDVVRDQWQYHPSAVSRTTYAPSDQTAAFLRERFGLQVGPDGRLERIATT